MRNKYATGIRQTIHYFTPGHPFIHWLGGSSFAVNVGILVLCQLQILKTFTVITTFLTERYIRNFQIIYFVWVLVFVAQSFWFLSSLGTVANDSLFLRIASVHFQVFVTIAVFIESWNTIFISLLIIKHRCRPEIPTTPSMAALHNVKTKLMFSKKTTYLVVYLGFMLSYLWFSVGMWILAYSFPKQTPPWQTTVRVK
jgi:hypothetical protein